MNDEGIRSPLESHSSFRGDNWSPERLVFHQNPEQFAERVGLIVGLQANGKIDQETAFDEIKGLWGELKESKKGLIN